MKSNSRLSLLLESRGETLLTNEVSNTPAGIQNNCMEFYIKLTFLTFV